MYYRIMEDIYTDYSITHDPDVASHVSFLNGKTIQEAFTETLIFDSNCTQQHRPRHFLQLKIPVFSEAFVNLVRKAGGDNLQVFPAKIINSEQSLEWDKYYAVNVLGLLSCVDMDKSEYTVIDQGGDVFPPLVKFHEIVIEEERTLGQKIFRLAESPTDLVIHEDILSAIDAEPQQGGWGVSIIDIESR